MNSTQWIQPPSINEACLAQIEMRYVSIHRPSMEDFFRDIVTLHPHEKPQSNTFIVTALHYLCNDKSLGLYFHTLYQTDSIFLKKVTHRFLSALMIATSLQQRMFHIFCYTMMTGSMLLDLRRPENTRSLLYARERLLSFCQDEEVWGFPFETAINHFLDTLAYDKIKFETLPKRSREEKALLEAEKRSFYYRVAYFSYKLASHSLQMIGHLFLTINHPSFRHLFLARWFFSLMFHDVLNILKASLRIIPWLGGEIHAIRFFHYETQDPVQEDLKQMARCKDFRSESVRNEKTMVAIENFCDYFDETPLISTIFSGPVRILVSFSLLEAHVILSLFFLWKTLLQPFFNNDSTWKESHSWSDLSWNIHAIFHSLINIIRGVVVMIPFVGNAIVYKLREQHFLHSVEYMGYKDPYTFSL